jgi:hypothetical protein
MITPGTVPASPHLVKILRRFTKTGCCGKAFGIRNKSMRRLAKGTLNFARAYPAGMAIDIEITTVTSAMAMLLKNAGTMLTAPMASYLETQCLRPVGNPTFWGKKLGQYNCSATDQTAKLRWGRKMIRSERINNNSWQI